LANSALAIRIIFPSVRVIQVSFNLTGLPASLGKQKTRSKAGFQFFRLDVSVADLIVVADLIIFGRRFNYAAPPYSST
jgi:hypothetical protein